MHKDPLSSCRAATCWRGARDAFKHFENKRAARKMHTRRSNRCKPPTSHNIDRLDLGSEFVRPAKSTRSNNVPDPNPMPIKDGPSLEKSKLVYSKIAEAGDPAHLT